MTATVRVMSATETPTADARAMTFRRPVNQTSTFKSLNPNLYTDVRN